ncbi:50S ribosomal protein L10 [Candidatus Giovannonibacteria bacterium]|nr:50S ribosomal protein L10 [Candidatus Giovannonibacteria bacterium]
MITKQQKSEIVKHLKNKLANSEFVAFLNFHGMSVAKATELRRVLKKVGAEYVVAKKTLLGVASKEANLEIDKSKLEGEVAIAVSQNGEEGILSITREINSFIKKNTGILKTIGGFWSGRWVEPAEIKRLASIPSREILLTQLAFMLSQPVASLARVLSEIQKSKIKGQN